MQIEQIKTEDLIPYARNTRTHSPEQVTQIAGSIREFGFTNHVLIDAKNGRIARLMELEPKYCDVIVTRWQEFAGKQAIHEASGKAFDEMKAAKP